jgi:hypothetical protein
MRAMIEMPTSKLTVCLCMYMVNRGRQFLTIYINLKLK